MGTISGDGGKTNHPLQGQIIKGRLIDSSGAGQEGKTGIYLSKKGTSKNVARALVGKNVGSVEIKVGDETYRVDKKSVARYMRDNPNTGLTLSLKQLPQFAKIAAKSAKSESTEKKGLIAKLLSMGSKKSASSTHSSSKASEVSVQKQPPVQSDHEKFKAFLGDLKNEFETKETNWQAADNMGIYSRGGVSSFNDKYTHFLEVLSTENNIELQKTGPKDIGGIRRVGERLATKAKEENDPQAELYNRLGDGIAKRWEKKLKPEAPKRMALPRNESTPSPAPGPNLGIQPNSKVDVKEQADKSVHAIEIQPEKIASFLDALSPKIQNGEYLNEQEFSGFNPFQVLENPQDKDQQQAKLNSLKEKATNFLKDVATKVASKNENDSLETLIEDLGNESAMKAKPWEEPKNWASLNSEEREAELNKYSTELIREQDFYARLGQYVFRSLSEA